MCFEGAKHLRAIPANERVSQGQIDMRCTTKTGIPAHAGTVAQRDSKVSCIPPS
eukprot:m.142780 g.142780  ORF g.142780 m.142780 type:complete len:54 (+) comp14080_c0_seq7:1755-1916(+)